MGTEADDETAIRDSHAYPGRGGARDGAARRLGLLRTTLIYKMRKLGIEPRKARRARAVRQDELVECPAHASLTFGDALGGPC